MSINVVADVAIHIPVYVAIAVAIPLLLYYRSAEGITSLLPQSPSNALHCYRSVYNIILQCQLIVCCCCCVSYLSTTRGPAIALLQLLQLPRHLLCNFAAVAVKLCVMLLLLYQLFAPYINGNLTIYVIHISRANM